MISNLTRHPAGSPQAAFMSTAGVNVMGTIGI